MQVDKSKKFNFLYSSQVHVLLSLPQDAEFLTICAYYNLREITFSKQNITLLHAVRTNQVFSIKKVLLRQPVPRLNATKTGPYFVLQDGLSLLEGSDGSLKGPMITGKKSNLQVESRKWGGHYHLIPSEFLSEQAEDCNSQMIFQISLHITKTLSNSARQVRNGSHQPGTHKANTSIATLLSLSRQG